MSTLDKTVVGELAEHLENAELQAFDVKKITAEIVGAPTIEEAAPPADIANVFEYYSR